MEKSVKSFLFFLKYVIINRLNGFFKRFHFLENGEGREKEKKRNINVSIRQPFGLQAGVQSSEPHQHGQKFPFLLNYETLLGPTHDKDVYSF